MRNWSGSSGLGKSIAITQPAVVHGLGGVGKTQLAAAYAWQERACYDAVLWAMADTAEGLQANLASLTRSNALNLPEADEKDIRVQAAAVLTWLRRNSRWLLVLDSADSPEVKAAIQEALSGALPGRVLVTTRLTEWPVDYVPVEVPVLPVPAARKFLLERTARGKESAGSAEHADKLAKELGCLPLALEQAGAYIVRHVITFADYIGLLEQLPGKVLREKAAGATRYERSVLDTWLISEKKISPLARTILRVAGLLAPEAIPRDLFAGKDRILRAAVAALCEELGLTAPAPDAELDAEAALVELAGYSLIALCAQDVLLPPVGAEGAA